MDSNTLVATFLCCIHFCCIIFLAIFCCIFYEKLYKSKKANRTMMWTIIFTHFIQKSVLIFEKITGAHPIWMELLTNLDVVNRWINRLHFSGTISQVKIGLHVVWKVSWKKLWVGKFSNWKLKVGKLFYVIIPFQLSSNFANISWPSQLQSTFKCLSSYFKEPFQLNWK